MRIRVAESANDIDLVRELFREYFQQLNANICFQDFEQELGGLPGMYAPPHGCLLLAEDADSPAGCAGVRPSSGEACELKRVYVRPKFRGKGMGHKIVLAALHQARRIGYPTIRLDTLPSMAIAQRLYESLGFYDIPPCSSTPFDGKRDMELRLNVHKD